MDHPRRLPDGKPSTSTSGPWNPPQNPWIRRYVIWAVLSLVTGVILGQVYQFPYSPMTNSLGSELIGSWKLLDHCAYLPHFEDDKTYPHGTPQGMIQFTSDGYMSLHLQSISKQTDPGAEKSQAESKTVWFLPNRYTAYTGRFHAERLENSEWGTLAVHVMLANLPQLNGTLQKRKLRIKGDGVGRLLVLENEQPMDLGGELRIVQIVWAKL